MRMCKIPCEIIKDLLPNYLEGLTSEVTSAKVEEHLSSCEDCSRALAALREPVEGPAPQADGAEIDFLRKNKRRNRRILCGALLAVLAVATGLFLRFFIIGSRVNNDSVRCDLSIDGRELAVKCTLTADGRNFSKVYIDENNGVVSVLTRTVLASPLFKDSFETSLTAEQNIKEVRVNNVTIWADGVNNTEFSPEMELALREDWASWEAMSIEEHLYSSRLPGDVTCEFASTEEALRFMGGELLMLLEDDGRFDIMNSVGTDIVSPWQGDLQHCAVNFQGTAEGVENAMLTAGYRYSANGARVVYSAAKGCDLRVFAGENVQELVIDNGIGDSIVILLEGPVAYANAAGAAGKSFELNISVPFIPAATVYFMQDGVLYSIRIIGNAEASDVNDALNTVLSVLESKLPNYAERTTIQRRLHDFEIVGLYGGSDDGDD